MNLRSLFGRVAASLFVWSFVLFEAVYVPANNQMVVFGGATNTSAFNGTRVLSSTNGLGARAWGQLTPSGIPPAPRESSSTVYDSFLNRMIIYGGGFGGTTYTDVWALQLPASTTTLLTLSTNPQRIDQPVTLTATVTSSISVTGTVTFKAGTLVLGTVTVSQNQASLTHTFFVTTNVTASYSGDGDNLASTSAVLTQVMVSRFTSTTTVSASTDSAYYHDFVTLQSRVTGPVAATGSVLFYDGTILLGAAMLDSNGVAILTRNTLPVGTAAISAKYVGSATLMPSANNVTVTINLAPSTIQVVSSLNPANAGDPMDLVATVNSTTGLITTGTVTFSQNGTVLGPPVTLSGGRAVFTTNILATGTNTLDVSYSGSSTIAPSATQYTQQVN